MNEGIMGVGQQAMAKQLSVSTALRKEDWDFRDLPAAEILPAVLWEFRRESAEIDKWLEQIRDWIAATLTGRFPSNWPGKRPSAGIATDEGFRIGVTAMAIFSDFIPAEEMWVRHKGGRNEQLRDYHVRIAQCLRPVVNHHGTPWFCLPSTERHRLVEIHRNNLDANVVRVGAWWDAVRTYQTTRPDPGFPLKFDFSNHSTVLLTIDWRYSKKRIIAAFGRLLDAWGQAGRAGVKPWDRRGRKDRDLLVLLERLAVMRLLHHYTLAELKLKLPEAWTLYSGRKWYDDRRRALSDFRDVLGLKGTSEFPKSWLTKARRRVAGPMLPAKS